MDEHQTMSELNTICPVCGERIDDEVPPVNLSSDADHPRVIRVCSTDCADTAVLDPDRYLEAAASGRAAHAPDDRPVIDDGTAQP